MTTISVSGSRNFNNRDYLNSVLNYYSSSISLVKVGDAKGLDSMVIQYCQERSIPYQVLIADWKTHGKAAGPIRNIEIINGTTLLLAFPAPDSKGTINAMNYAFKSGISVHVYDKW
jgi:hypothetical protein